MIRSDIGFADDDEACLFKGCEQFRSRSQFQMFGKIRGQQPAFSFRTPKGVRSLKCFPARPKVLRRLPSTIGTRVAMP